jgi:hypothetical protein
VDGGFQGGGDLNEARAADFLCWHGNMTVLATFHAEQGWCDGRTERVGGLALAAHHCRSFARCPRSCAMDTSPDHAVKGTIMKSSLLRWALLTIIGLCPLASRSASAGDTPAPATTQPAIKDDALRAVLRLAQAHRNPYVREQADALLPTADSTPFPSAAEAWHIGRWSIDPAKRSFSVTLADPQARVVTGTLGLAGNGLWSAKFQDDDAISREWTPAGDAKLTPEQARSALLAMCAKEEKIARMKLNGAWAMRGTAPRLLANALRTADEQLLATGLIVAGTNTWKIDFERRTFSAWQGLADTGWEYQGQIGWNKDRQWEAWITRQLSFPPPNMRGGRSPSTH